MKNMKNKMKQLTAGAVAGALFRCVFTACETNNNGEKNFNITRAQAESIATPTAPQTAPTMWCGWERRSPRCSAPMDFR